jgi:hypothetical protein
VRFCAIGFLSRFEQSIAHPFDTVETEIIKICWLR